MKTYKIETKEEYCHALLDILQNTKIGMIQYKIAGNAKNCNLISVLDLHEQSIIYMCSFYRPLSTLLKENAKYFAGQELIYKGIFANNTLYDTGYGLIPYGAENNEILPVKSTTLVIKEIQRKIKQYIKDSIITTFPNYESIPEEYKKTITESCIANKLRAILLKEEVPTTYQIEYIPESVCSSIQEIIAYDRAKLKGIDWENDFIKDKAERYLSSSVWNNKTVYKTKVETLAEYYAMKDLMDKTGGKLTEEDVIFLEIKHKIQEFLKEYPEIQKVKVYFTGKDSMMDEYIHMRHTKFSIENKSILLTMVAKDLTTYASNKENEYNNNNMEIKYPKLRNKFNTGNILYISHLHPLDIEKITADKIVIYEKGKNV